MKHTAPTLSLAADPAPCMTRDPELWFSDYREDVDKAKAVCRRCPFTAECLAGAVKRREPLGVWGGVRFREGRPEDRRPAKMRGPTKHEQEAAAAAERKRQRRRDLERRRGHQHTDDLDPAKVERAVQAVAARLDVTGEVGELTVAERRAVIGRVYPRYGLSAAHLAELLGISERTVNRAASAGTRLARAVEAVA